MDKNKLFIYRPVQQDYRCFCVKPILEHQLTLEGITYNLRYVLCADNGACSLDAVEVLDGGGQHVEVKCSGACAGDCKCTLFKLQVGGPGFDVSKAKWERLGKADKQFRYEDHNIYRCFCVK